MARQKRMTCMTGRAKMKSMTPTFRTIRKKFFWISALIFPLVVHSLQLMQSLHASATPAPDEDIDLPPFI